MSLSGALGSSFDDVPQHEELIRALADDPVLAIFVMATEFLQFSAGLTASQLRCLPWRFDQVSGFC